MTTNAIRCNYKVRGFSLIELLVVMAVISIMVTLMMPAISGFSSTAGRRGAVNTLMNTFEQARVAGLESGKSVYVVFWRRIFPEADAVMVLRDTDDGTGKYEQLTRWIKMPKNILLHQPLSGQSMLSSVFSSVPTTIFDASRWASMPALASGESLNLMAFNNSGAVQYPTANRRLFVSEGMRGTGGNEATISSAKDSAGGFEIITLAHYTGRAQLDVSTTGNVGP